MRSIAAVLALLLLAAPALPSERGSRTEVHWNSTIPDAKKTPDGTPPKPLLIYVPPKAPTRDGRRFAEVVLHNETACLAMKFFVTVKVSEDRAKTLPLLSGIRYRVPALIAFDSTRKKHAVATGRASAMKIYGLLCRACQCDYETSVAQTVRNARNLLATFDQIDAARDSLGIKKSRAAEAAADGKGARARKLEQEIVLEQAEIDRMYAKAQKRWEEIWSLRRKIRKD
jgi:hypothetical protein